MNPDSKKGRKMYNTYINILFHQKVQNTFSAVFLQTGFDVIYCSVLFFKIGLVSCL